MQKHKFKWKPVCCTFPLCHAHISLLLHKAVCFYFFSVTHKHVSLHKPVTILSLFDTKRLKIIIKIIKRSI